VPYFATFISFFIEYLIASIAYIHPVYGGIQTYDRLNMSRLPLPLEQASRLFANNFMILFLSSNEQVPKALISEKSKLLRWI
jgi:hypothetical protein